MRNVGPGLQLSGRGAAVRAVGARRRAACGCSRYVRVGAERVTVRHRVVTLFEVTTAQVT